MDGDLFFASSNDLCTQFDYANDPANIVIDMPHPTPGMRARFRLLMQS